MYTGGTAGGPHINPTDHNIPCSQWLPYGILTGMDLEWKSFPNQDEGIVELFSKFQQCQDVSTMRIRIAAEADR